MTIARARAVFAGKRVLRIGRKSIVVFATTLVLTTRSAKRPNKAARGHFARVSVVVPDSRWFVRGGVWIAKTIRVIVELVDSGVAGRHLFVEGVCVSRIVVRIFWIVGGLVRI